MYRYSPMLNAASTCVICGRNTIAGENTCPACQWAHEQKQQARRVPIYDNPSHDGEPIGYRIIPGESLESTIY